MNLLINVDEIHNKQIVKSFKILDKKGKQRDIECSFTLLNENGNPIGNPIPSGSFNGMKTPTMHMIPEELFDLEYGLEYIEGFTIDGEFYTREAADQELGGSGDNLQSEDMYKDF